MFFFIVPTNLSASPLASGHNGVIFRCLNPLIFAYSAKFLLLNAGPLSIFTTNRIPHHANTISILGMTVLAMRDEIISTSG